MILTADYHTHTKFSDAHSTVEEMVGRAAELGLKEIAVTDHGFTHISFGIRRKQKSQYLRELKAAGEKYRIPVLVGIEGNILGREGTSDLLKEDFEDFDVYLAGFHVFSHHESWRDWANGWRGYLGYNLGLHLKGRIVEDQTKAYINTVKKNPIDVLTHINFQCFANSVEVAKCCRDYGTYVEISGKKTHFTDDELAEIVNIGVRFVVNSDAHSPERIGDIAIAMQQIERVGVPLDRIDNIDGRTPNFRFAEFKKRL